MIDSKVVSADAFLGNLPRELRDELLGAFNRIVLNYREHRWEPSELNGGKLCEVVHSILKGFVDGKYPPRASKPRNMVDACRELEHADSTRFSRSLRIQIPRMLVALYEIRNNRGVGHVGGDVDPNHMDATAVLAMSKWVLAELVRIFHGVDTKTAATAVEAIVERHLPIIWRVNGKVRVLATKMTMKDKMLAVLYQSPGPVLEANLVDWVEHSNPSVFRREVLAKAHKARLIEYDRHEGTAQISPLGVQYVEDNLRLGL
jgi:hypothetical protein